MRSAPLALLLLVLPVACVDDPSGGDAEDGGISLDSPAVERCEETVQCGLDECAAEAAAVRDCLDAGCDDAEAAFIAREQCIIDAGCWWVDCDIVASYMEREVCPLPGEQDVVDAISSGLFVGEASECAVLE